MRNNIFSIVNIFSRSTYIGQKEVKVPYLGASITFPKNNTTLVQIYSSMLARDRQLYTDFLVRLRRVSTISEYHRFYLSEISNPINAPILPYIHSVHKVQSVVARGEEMVFKSEMTHFDDIVRQSNKSIYISEDVTQDYPFPEYFNFWLDHVANNRFSNSSQLEYMFSDIGALKHMIQSFNSNFPNERPITFSTVHFAAWFKRRIGEDGRFNFYLPSYFVEGEDLDDTKTETEMGMEMEIDEEITRFFLNSSKEKHLVFKELFKNFVIKQSPQSEAVSRVNDFYNTIPLESLSGTGDCTMRPSTLEAKVNLGKDSKNLDSGIVEAVSCSTEVQQVLEIKTRHPHKLVKANSLGDYFAKTPKVRRETMEKMRTRLDKPSFKDSIAEGDEEVNRAAVCRFIKAVVVDSNDGPSMGSSIIRRLLSDDSPMLDKKNNMVALKSTDGDSVMFAQYSKEKKIPQNIALVSTDDVHTIQQAREAYSKDLAMVHDLGFPISFEDDELLE
jgi:hypothetical protein